MPYHLDCTIAVNSEKTFLRKDFCNGGFAAAGSTVYDDYISTVGFMHDADFRSALLTDGQNRRNAKILFPQTFVVSFNFIYGTFSAIRAFYHSTPS
jgi:hypothetical protein